MLHELSCRYVFLPFRKLKATVIRPGSIAEASEVVGIIIILLKTLG